MMSRCIALAAVIAASSPALACDQKADFFDDFAKPDPSWGASSATAILADRQMTLKPTVNSYQPWANMAYLYTNATICADALQPTGSDVGSVKVGILFWRVDPATFYIAYATGAGQALVYRHTSAGWITLLGPLPAPSYRTAAGARNELVLALTGNTGTLSINGAKVTDFKAQAPKAQWTGGPVSESGAEEVAAVFTQYAVTETP